MANANAIITEEIICSFDVGIKNLAYCIIKKTDKLYNLELFTIITGKTKALPEYFSF